MDLSPLSKVVPSWDSPTLQGFDLDNVQDGQRIGGLNRGIHRQFVRFYKKKFSEVYATKVKINEKTGTTTVLETDVRNVEKEMVHIITPGDKNIVDDVACEFHKREHWAEYKAFRDGRSAPLGTSLDECSFVSPHIATELRYHGCLTLEQLADASDLLCERVPDGFEIREFARAKVKADRDNQSLDQVNALKIELSKSREAMAEMQKQIEKLSGLVTPSGEPIEAIKRRGRAPVKPEGMVDEKSE